MSRDAQLIIVARALRTFGQGSAAVLLGIYLHLLGFSPLQIGLFISAGQASMAAFTFGVVFLAEVVGRKRLLVIFSLLAAGASLAMVITDSYPLLVTVAFLGSFSVAGGGAAGPAQPVEQASLAGTVKNERRTDLYAVYNVLNVGGGALGALAAGLPVVYQSAFGMAEVPAYKVVFATLAGINVLAAAFYAFLSPAVEAAPSGSKWTNPLRLPSRRLIFTLSALFGVDSFAGGMTVQSLVSLWFYTRFGVELGSIAFIFFGSNLMAAISMWVAARLARRIGLINTMVFTHIPSSLFLIAMPFLPSAWMAAAFWLARGFFGMMDVPTRQSYTMAVVGPEERSAMAGINSLTRNATGTVSPSVATAIWNVGVVGLPFIVCGVLKIAYDLSLWAMFKDVRTPEEEARKARRRVGVG